MKFRRMIWSRIWDVACGHRSRSPNLDILLPRRNAGRLHWGIAESIQLCDSRVGQATTGAEAQFWLRQPWRNLPLLSPILPLTFAPPLFYEGLGISPWKNCGIKDVCRLVLEHYDGLMRLIIFPWNKKVNSSDKFPYLFCRTIFPCRISRRRGCFWTPLVAVYQKANPAYPGFYNGGVHVVGAWPWGPGDVSPPMGTRGKAPVGVLGDEVPHKLKNNVKLSVQLLTFSCRKCSI